MTVNNNLKELNVNLSINDIYYVYQPIVDVISGKVKYYECLVRHTDSSITPEYIVESFKTQDEDKLLWLHLLKTSFDFLSATPLDTIVSINLCPSHLGMDWLMLSIYAKISQHKVDCSRLIIEITEGCKILNKEQSIKVIDEIRSMGIKVALDDFGTCYSNLDVLISHKFDMVKIDGHFIENIEENSSVYALVCIADLAQKLGMSIVAEKVETKQQCDKLISLGITLIQGYLYSKPITEDKIKVFVDSLNLSVSAKSTVL